MSIQPTKHFELFRGKTLLSIDFGTVVTGLAIFTPGRDPFPMIQGKINFKNTTQLAQEIKKVVDEECVDILIMGLPLYLDGK